MDSDRPSDDNTQMVRLPKLAPRVGIVVTALLLAVGAGIALGEALGWPFLAGPMQRWLGSTLHRTVVFGTDPAQPQIHTRLLGGIQVSGPSILIGAPAWSQAPHTFLARDAHLSMSYPDLLRAWRGQSLRIAALHAATLDANLERLADGRASWQFGRATQTPSDADAKTPAQMPSFGLLHVGSGRVAYRDALLATQLDVAFALDEGTSTTPAFRLQATGRYRTMPASASLQTSGLLPLVAPDRSAPAVPMRLEARVGRASMTFNGTATDALDLGALRGRFDVQGPSLAAVGDPLHVTLPTTGRFRAQGLVTKEGRVWSVVPEQVSIGSSRLNGAFTYDARSRVPVLSGRLGGTRLLLADLGPAVGARVPHTDASKPTSGRVLPDRPFDLPSLRAMNANVLVAIDSLDLGSQVLAPLEPLRAHLVLDGGVLTLNDLDARTAQGRLGGTVQFDGRRERALWRADLRWAGVRLEQWIHAARSGDAPPYVTGRLSGRMSVDGEGRSTAAILGSLHGSGRMQLAGGTISHLAVEAAGLDLAQGLGVLIKGDDALPVECTVAELTIDQGLLRPRALVLDTRDSTLWIDGSLSLATEHMDVRLVATPKDFSPLTLRSPLRVSGTFADPTISLDNKGQLGAKLGAAALLGLLNPLAALIPLVDLGEGDSAARQSGEGCRNFAQRVAAGGGGGARPKPSK